MDVELPTSPLGRLRLLVALDALLVEGSVTAAARALDMGVPAMSRLLSQLRALYDDDLVTRTGRKLVPTPFAETLRPRVRALAAEAAELVHPKAVQERERRAGGSGLKPPLVQHAPLAMKPTPLIEGQPDHGVIVRRLAGIDGAAEPKQRLARYIATIGAGVGQTRPLTQDEAQDAVGIVLEGEADPIQIGALLVAMQYRGVTANELAGMASAARRNFIAIGTSSPAADLDWPAYLSPRNTNPPWFLLAALLVARAGHRVLLHGFGRGLGPLHEALDATGIPLCLSVDEAATTLRGGGIAYMPLSAADQQLQALMSLYRLFEMRSPLNMVVQLLNPLAAPRTIVGVPSAAGRTLQRDAAAALGWPGLLAVGSNRDVAQATPFRAMPLALLEAGHTKELSVRPVLPRLSSKARSGFTAAEYCLGLWDGRVRDDYALETVIATAALALMICGPRDSDFDQARRLARDLWSDRNSKLT
ncbi:glycosyl transferase family protein [Mesorhizobium sp. CAU 1741]|uniref:glycosyl transferase family protein n=1 Tax=Mesorhizobium sp. CAU 1741 TaxID=3140366 RepID=UPI00325B978E